MNGPRVALVTPYNALAPGGIATYVEGLARALARHGCDVEILSPGDQPEETPGIARRRLAGPGRLREMLAVYRGLRACAPDVVHVHGPWYHLLGAVEFLAAGGAARLVATRHTMPVRRFSPLQRMVEGALLARCDALAVPAAATAAALERVAGLTLRVPVRVVGAGVDRPSSDRVRSGSEARASWIGTIANLVYPEKVAGILDLIAVLGHLRTTGRAVRLTVVGADAGGAAPPALRAAAEAAGVADLVEFAGTLVEPWSRLEGIAAYVHPSRRESLSLAILEAMSRGLPVVAADVGGLREVMRDGRDGLMYPAGDHAALRTILEKLLEDAELRDRLGAQARLSAARFDWDVVAARHLAIYADEFEPPGDASSP